ncbi:ATP-binding protein [Streptomyces sp. B1866]|uniref:ATP-binding protein n=1 Tax=Streptomyces sp. B1866 TaxID=3075431 RepID=UPI00288EFD42|nr:ATP-binding protein [Streptomyces sp. B1866]MDT3397197.1 ATP-binding protein [Streptomyces sp. B1866]
MPTYRHTFPGLPEQILRARRFAAQCLTGSPASAAIRMMISEIATNAIQHSRSGHPGGHFTVTVMVQGNRVRVEIEDGGPRAGGVPHARAATPDAESGRGLAVVQALADAYGTIRPNIVWFELEAPPMSFRAPWASE